MDSNDRFSIFSAVKSAYIFTGREWLYLAKASLLPIGVQIIISLFVLYQRPQASFAEQNLWDIPAALALGWFIFLVVRLMLLGERQGRLLPDRKYLSARWRAMQACVLAFVLFSMGLDVARTAAEILWSIVAQAGPDAPGSLVNGCMLLAASVVGVILWALRFGIVPILAAVHHPIRPVLRRTRSMFFSFRLLGLSFLCALPISLVFELIVGTLIPGAEELPPKLTDPQQVAIIIINAVLTVLCLALLAAGAADALKQILGANRRGGAA